MFATPAHIRCSIWYVVRWFVALQGFLLPPHTPVPVYQLLDRAYVRTYVRCTGSTVRRYLAATEIYAYLS